MKKPQLSLRLLLTLFVPLGLGLAVVYYSMLNSDIRIGTGMSPDTDLHVSCWKGNINQVRRILRDDPSLLEQTDSYGRTALHWGALGDQLEVVTILLSVGANPNTTDTFDRIPIDYAKSESVRKLLARVGIAPVGPTDK